MTPTGSAPARAPGGLVPSEELKRLSSWPGEVARSDLTAYFTLSLEDLRLLRRAAKMEVAKLAYLEGLDADRLDLRAIPPERLRQLATVARRSTPRALRLMDPERRHPILLAALAAAHTEIVDETVRVFDMMLSATDRSARDVSPSASSTRFKRTSSGSSCWTRSSTSSSTPTSTVPKSAAPCGRSARA